MNFTPWLDEQLAPNDVPVKENFSTWFAKSRVVDEEGQPSVLYHGTSASAFNAFDAANGVHFGSREQALDRIGQADADHAESCGPRLIPVFLSIVNPYRASDQGSEWEETIEEAKRLGHDGIVYLNRGEGLGDAPNEDAIANAETDAQFLQAAPSARDSWIAFRPEQIKRADNCGLFLVGSADLTDLNALEALEAGNRARALVEINSSPARPASLDRSRPT